MATGDCALLEATGTLRSGLASTRLGNATSNRSVKNIFSGCENCFIWAKQTRHGTGSRERAGASVHLLRKWGLTKLLQKLCLKKDGRATRWFLDREGAHNRRRVSRNDVPWIQCGQPALV